MDGQTKRPKPICPFGWGMRGFVGAGGGGGGAGVSVWGGRGLSKRIFFQKNPNLKKNKIWVGGRGRGREKRGWWGRRGG